MNQSLMLALNSAALTIASLSSSVALRSAFVQSRSGKPKDRFYEDADGCATPRTLANFSNRGAKACILLFSAIGTGTSVGSLVASIIYNGRGGSAMEVALRVAAWTLTFIHAVCIALQHSPVKCHNLGLWLLSPAFFLAISSIPRLKHLSTFIQHSPGDVAVLLAINILAAIGLAIASISLPRRPDVFHNNVDIDRQWTVSVINRLTWSWIQPLLNHAALQRDVDVSDVPQADSRLRSQELKSQWDDLKQHASLFRQLVAAYKGKIAFLWAVTLVRCAISILPFWLMLRIINILEEETARSGHVQLMSFVLCMALSNLLDSWMEGWSYWYSLSSLALPIRSQVSGLIFDKVLRRKNIRAASPNDSSSGSEDDGASPEDTAAFKSHQAVVNLVGIDTERLSYFFQYHFLIITGIVKLIVFSAFLLQILGWIPLVSGIMAWIVTLPLNIRFSGKVLTESRSLMKHRDTKLSQIQEVLLGIRQIKFSALEAQWEKGILALREAELSTLWKFFLADSGLFACWVISPVLLAIASLTAYVLLHSILLPSVAFVSIGVFNTLEITLGSLPELFTLGLESLVSLKRISTYLDKPEKQTIITFGAVISFDNASISWPTDGKAPEQEKFVLDKLHLSFPDHALSIVSGKVGTGKTLLLSAILGEADLLQGSIRVPKAMNFENNTTDDWIIPGSIAYVSQTPWLENRSFRNNILFGLPLHQTRYNKVLEACALLEDLASLPDGDNTELGPNGINLSGGQKWRITLARAVYSQAGILLLEDIFSAVDSHVGAWIYDRCLTGDICRGRTRIVVTHHLALAMSGASFIVELGDGGVAYSGPPKRQAELPCRRLEGRGESTSDTEHSVTESDQTLNVTNVPESPSAEPTAAPRKFMQEEIRQKGTVKGGIYMTYMRGSGGLYLWAVCIGIYLAYQAGILGRAWCLRIWTAQADTNADSSRISGHHIPGSAFSTQQLLFRSSSHTTPHPDVLFYLKLYISISVGTAVIGILRYISSYFLAVRASRALFKKMLFAVMHAPLRWLDTVHTGRILNRFTADFNTVDERLTMTWSLFFSNLLRLISICIASCFASAYLIPPAFILLSFGAITGSKYLAASRPLKRLESNAKSPVFELFNTTLAGISTIRAFQRTQNYLEQMHENLDAWVMTTFYIALANRWMSFRMALITALFSIAVGIVIVVKPIDAALAGLALSFVLDFSESLRWTIRCYGDMELEMNSMERIVEYMNLYTEPLGGVKPAAAWPTSGSLELKELEVAYALDLPPVLKGLSLRIRHGERVGVVGRTGAGKSSLTLALFRFLEARSGSIAIDGVDISKLALNDLRSRLSIIPQHPVLFSGTVRSNLDPFGEYTDAQLYDALVRVHLISVGDSANISIFRNLSSPISESGGNLSQGQQQLLCIARALLAPSKIIVLDEATSAIDVATDTFIQQSIREWFTNRTMIVIAHRLSTVADFDKVLVLDGGRMVEFGTPRELWEKNGGFRGMCESTGDSEKENLRKIIMR